MQSSGKKKEDDLFIYARFPVAEAVESVRIICKISPICADADRRLREAVGAAKAKKAQVPYETDMGASRGAPQFTVAA